MNKSISFVLHMAHILQEAYILILDKISWFAEINCEILLLRNIFQVITYFKVLSEINMIPFTLQDQHFEQNKITINETTGSHAIFLVKT